VRSERAGSAGCAILRAIGLFQALNLIFLQLENKRALILLCGRRGHFEAECEEYILII
jgi:hypothetical protein